MREIKVRVWHRNIKEYVQASRFLILDGDGMLYNSDCDIEQFTGLLDRKGVEIYEGDIVSWRDYVDASAMSEKYGYDENWPSDTEEWIWLNHADVVTMDRFPKYWLKNERFGYEGEDLISPDQCEVIGNIHQNPELLKCGS